MELSRNELIEWLQKNYAMLPPHVTVAMTHSKPINEQETHILRQIKDYADYWFATKY